MIQQTVICDICKEEIKQQDSAWLKLLTQHNGIAFGGMTMVPHEMHVHLRCWAERMGA